MEKNLKSLLIYEFMFLNTLGFSLVCVALLFDRYFFKSFFGLCCSFKHMCCGGMKTATATNLIPPTDHHPLQLICVKSLVVSILSSLLLNEKKIPCTVSSIRLKFFDAANAKPLFSMVLV